jgi:hypothetical protein
VPNISSIENLFNTVAYKHQEISQMTPVYSILYRKRINILMVHYSFGGERGSIVAKAICYNRKVAGSITEEVIFYIYLTLPAALGPGVYSDSNRNYYQKRKNNNVSEE